MSTSDDLMIEGGVRPLNYGEEEISVTINGITRLVWPSPPRIDPAHVTVSIIGTSGLSCVNPIVTFETQNLAAQFSLIHNRVTSETITYYAGGMYWSGCSPVPGDGIHARELSISPARHRLEHDLWHHLIGIHVYHVLGSPIIWRDAHHVPQPQGETRSVPFGGPTRAFRLINWGPVEEEEWLVTALSHRLHGDFSRDHGASIWLRDQGHDADAMVAKARSILDQIPH